LFTEGFVNGSCGLREALTVFADEALVPGNEEHTMADIVMPVASLAHVHGDAVLNTSHNAWLS